MDWGPTTASRPDYVLIFPASYATKPSLLPAGSHFPIVSSRLDDCALGNAECTETSYENHTTTKSTKLPGIRERERTFA